MKKLLYLFALVAAVFFVGCTEKFDDTQIWDSIHSLESRVNATETVLKACQNQLFISSVTEITGGYVIVFSDGSKATIVDGEDGQNGETLIKSVEVGESEVTFTLTDGSKFAIQLYNALDLIITSDPVVSPGVATRVGYEVKSNLKDITVEVLSSDNIRTKVVQYGDDPRRGYIDIAIGDTLDEYSKVIVFVSNGEKVVMRRLTFEDAKVIIDDNTVQRIGSEGGNWTLEFLTNTYYTYSETYANVNDKVDNWLAEVKKKSMEKRGIEFKVAPNPNNGSRRVTIEIKQDLHSSVLATFTLIQDGVSYKSTDYSEDGKIVELQAPSEPNANAINVVLMGDGFSDRQIASGEYDKVMKMAYDHLFDVEPYKSLRNYFRVSYITLVSRNEGFYEGSESSLGVQIGDGPAAIGGDGAKIAENTQKVIDHFGNTYSKDPRTDAIMIVIANSTYYAGVTVLTACTFVPEGSFGSEAELEFNRAISYLTRERDEEEFAEVLNHEALGHGFGKLADEHWSYNLRDVKETNSVETIAWKTKHSLLLRWFANVDVDNNPATIKWASFLSDNRYKSEGLGVYEGAYLCGRGVWRSTENSIMRYYTGGFNAPSREQIWRRVQEIAYGDKFEFNHEDFVKFDIATRANSASDKSVPNYLGKPKDFIPLPPPIVEIHTN